jgi:hypothetical protein
MTLPGFNAETSLYKTSVHYRSMGTFVQAHPVTLQPQLASIDGPYAPLPGAYCGPCYNNYRLCCDEFGNCSRESCHPL